MVKIIKKKKSTSSSDSTPTKVMSTRERMLQRKKKLEERKGSGGLIFPKEGTMRVRLMSQGDDKELGLEVIQFYLGKDKGGIISPATFDEPCPFMDKYRELKESKDEDDNELAKMLTPRRRYIVGGTCYKDEKGKGVDPDRICKPILIPRQVYQGIIDLYLDEDDWGDMTDIEEGYDIKITRSGSGLMDTTYTVNPCPGRKPLDPKYRKEMDLEEIIRGQMKSYDELEEALSEFLGEAPSMGEDDDEKPKVKKKKTLKGKKYKGDI